MSLKKKFNTSCKSLNGKTVVFTGKMKKHTRKQLRAIARELGAIVRGNVSGRTAIVVAGKKAGTKLQAAAAHGVRILNERDFFAVVKKQRNADKRAKGM